MRGIGAVVRGAFTEAFARRASFWSQVATMVVNDAVWIAFWLIFFNRVGTLRGWNMHRILLLYAILTTSAGLVLGALSNAKRIGQLAAEGDLDAVLALPVAPLPHLLVRRVDTVNLGDIAFGIVLFAATGTPTPQRILTYLGGVAASCMVLVGFLVATGSIALFAGRNEAGEISLHSILLLATYPVDIFTGTAKALLYTVVPAAFVSAVPSTLLDRFDLRRALLMVCAATVFAGGGWLTFTLGLRRYTSGSAWTRV
jgi:ABC-2 type transport system permease protein